MAPNKACVNISSVNLLKMYVCVCRRTRVAKDIKVLVWGREKKCFQFNGGHLINF